MTFPSNTTKRHFVSPSQGCQSLLKYCKWGLSRQHTSKNAANIHQNLWDFAYFDHSYNLPKCLVFRGASGTISVSKSSRTPGRSWPRNCIPLHQSDVTQQIRMDISSKQLVYISKPYLRYKNTNILLIQNHDNKILGAPNMFHWPSQDWVLDFVHQAKCFVRQA